jgi:hypothetical protein
MEASLIATIACAANKLVKKERKKYGAGDKAYQQRVLNVLSVGVALESLVGGEIGLAVLDVKAVGVRNSAVVLRNGCVVHGASRS